MKKIWSDGFKTHEKMIFLVIILFGTAIRVYDSITHLPWADELYTYYLSVENSFTNLLTMNYWDNNHPPLANLFYHFWGKIGYEPLVLRIPVIASSIIIAYNLPIISRRIFPQLKYFPLITLTVYEFSNLYAAIDMIIRPYPFVFLSMVLSLKYFVTHIIVSQNDSRRKVITFFLINASMFLIDYAAVWLLLSYGVFWLVELITKKRNNKVLFKFLVLISAFCIVWFLFAFKDYHMTFERLMFIARHFEDFGTAAFKVYSDLHQFVGIGFDNIIVDSFRVDYLQVKHWIEIISAVFYGLAIMFLLYFSVKRYSIATFFLTVLTFPLLISFLFSLTVSPIFLSRNLIVIMLAFLFLKAIFLTFCIRYIKLTYVLIVFLGGDYLFYHHYKEPFYYDNGAYDASKIIIEAAESLPIKANNRKSFFFISSDEYLDFEIHIKYYMQLNGLTNMYLDNSEFIEREGPVGDISKGFIFFFASEKRNVENDSDLMRNNEMLHHIQERYACKMQEIIKRLTLKAYWTGYFCRK